MTKQVATVAYGEQILATLSQELTAEFGPGFRRPPSSGEQP